MNTIDFEHIIPKTYSNLIIYILFNYLFNYLYVIQKINKM